MIIKEIIDAINSGELSKMRPLLASEIRKGNLKRRHVERIIDAIYTSDYCEDILYENAAFPMNNNQEEWSSEYLRHISEAIICGDISEALLYHMAEVSAYVNRHYLWLQYAIGIVLTGIAVGIAVLIV